MEKNTKKELVGTTTVKKAFARFASKNEENETVLNTALKVKELIKQMVKERQCLGLTQRDYAEVSGIKQPMIARIERLESIPRLDTFIRMINKLGFELLLVHKDDCAKSKEKDDVNLTTQLESPF